MFSGFTLCLALLDIVRLSQTYTCPRITLCLAMSVYCVPTNACFMTTPSNKALQMDSHDSGFVTIVSLTLTNNLPGLCKSWIYRDAYAAEINLIFHINIVNNINISHSQSNINITLLKTKVLY